MNTAPVPAPAPIELGAPQQGPTATLHVMGKAGHWVWLGLAALSWLGEHLHLTGDQAQGTIQVTIGAAVVAQVGALVAHALATKGAQ